MDQLKKMLGRCRGSIMAAIAVSFLLFLVHLDEDARRFL